MQDITVEELKKRMDAGESLNVIDVREEWEFENDHIDALNIPLGDVPGKLDELADLKSKEVILVCRSGGRSGRITQFLAANGFEQARNLTGGMLAWKANIDPSFNVE